MNTVLFISACLSGYVHLLSFVYVNHINWLYMIGIATSVLNHGTTFTLIKRLDRFVMVIGVCFDIIKVREKNQMLLLLSSILMYLVAKQYDMVWCHVVSHIHITYLHILFA